MVKDYYRLVSSVNAREPHIQKLSDEQVQLLFFTINILTRLKFLILKGFLLFVLVVESKDRGIPPAVETGCNSS